MVPDDSKRATVREYWIQALKLLKNSTAQSLDMNLASAVAEVCLDPTPSQFGLYRRSCVLPQIPGLLGTPTPHPIPSYHAVVGLETGRVYSV